MKRGPKPKPSALRLFEGNPSHRPFSEREPKPSRQKPVRPAWLDAAGRKAWRRIVPELNRIGVLTLLDGDALAIYCDSWSRWRTACEFLDKHGTTYPVYEIVDGEKRLKSVKAFPQVRVARELLSVVNRYQQELGLTPAARTRIEVPVGYSATQDVDPSAKYFGGRKIG